MTDDTAPLLILTALLGAVVGNWLLQRARDAKLSASLEAPWTSSQIAGGSPPRLGRSWLGANSVLADGSNEGVEEEDREQQEEQERSLEQHEQLLLQQRGRSMRSPMSLAAGGGGGPADGASGVTGAEHAETLSAQVVQLQAEVLRLQAAAVANEAARAEADAAAEERRIIERAERDKEAAAGAAVASPSPASASKSLNIEAVLTSIEVESWVVEKLLEHAPPPPRTAPRGRRNAKQRAADQAEELATLPFARQGVGSAQGVQLLAAMEAWVVLLLKERPPLADSSARQGRLRLSLRPTLMLEHPTAEALAKEPSE